MRRALLLASLLVLVSPAAAHAAELACTAATTAAQRYEVTVAGEPTAGRFAAPAAAPTALVVLAHGYSYTSQAYEGHARRVTDATGALAVAPDYRGIRVVPPDGNRWGAEKSRGWPVRQGAEDLITVAQLALARCPSIRTVVLYGFSMGGNISGHALAAKPKRADGTPLFDFWVAVEGVHNLTELYYGARTIAPVNAFARQAEEDIRAETGGTPETAPEAYRSRTNVARVGDIAAAGLDGVVAIHAREDGEAAYNQAVELVGGLRQGGVPTDFYTIGSREPDDDPDTSITSYAQQDSGQAGHASDPSSNHITPQTAYDRVAALLVRAEPDPCGRDFAVEGRDRSVRPDPAQPTARCPRGEVRSQPGGGEPGGQPAAAGGGPAACGARAAAPRAVVVRRRGRGLVVTGRARRAACPQRRGALRAEVAVVRRSGRRCRSVWRSGRLGRAVPCSRVTWRRARGSSPWALRLPRVPRTGVVVLVRARDGHGAGRALTRRVRSRR